LRFARELRKKKMRHLSKMFRHHCDKDMKVKSRHFAGSFCCIAQNISIKFIFTKKIQYNSLFFQKKYCILGDFVRK